MAELEAWLSAVGRVGGWAVRPAARDFVPPRRALILKPCCMSQVMLATPLLQVLRQAYPQARFDWAVSRWARPVVATHPGVAELVDSGQVGLPGCTLAALRTFAAELKARDYDTALIPSRSSALAAAARLAGIPQRIGLDDGGRGFAHTMRVRPPAGAPTAEAYLALAQALGLDVDGARMEFFPTDEQRNAVFARLTEEIGWKGRRPIAILHPGGGRNPVRTDDRKRWPIERFALLGNFLARQCDALVLVAGSATDHTLSAGVAGIMSAPVLNLAGRIDLGELGALCELASLYVGNDAGPTHIAAAVGCPTVAIFGPNNPTFSRPHTPDEKLITLWEPCDEEFSWEKGVSVEKVMRAAETLLKK